ncbi:hypothetical protein CHS0354_005304 [Potamilus streckersoni]|uniref:IQ calmodulin-binding motif-containing protein 1 n=1 Tax=Potamilus streckersoni TaxID=2493646 RepID=A0AAE0SGP8_9BIVA|nr:hypothetical protein CHS0354_005304 [Potamilus streckersoni]
MSTVSTPGRSPGRSPTRDRRVLILAAEIAETKDRRVPCLLLTLREILDSAQATSQDGRRIRKEIVEYNLLEVLILVLKQDFSVVDGEWTTAAKLTAILSHVCIGMDLPGKEMQDFKDNQLPLITENIFLVARRVQARYCKLPNRAVNEKERTLLLSNLKTVLEALTYLASGYLEVTSKLIESPWLLQLLITDDAETVTQVMDMLPKVIRANWVVLKKTNQKTLYSIMDELIYKLSVDSNVNVGASATKCVLSICEYHKLMVEILCTRYRGLRPLLGKWDGRGFSRDLKNLLLLLEAGTAEQAQNKKYNQAAIVLQAYWKGYITRKKLDRANKSFSKFQKAFRNRREQKEQMKFTRQMESDAEYLGKLNRKKIMRDFKQRQLHTIEILPAAKVESYLQNEQTQAAIQIQRYWKGYNERMKISGRRDLAQQTRAAIKIQRGVRTWLERQDAKRGDIPVSLRPPGLTDERRQELHQYIVDWREENPPKHKTREEIEKLHAQTQSLLNRYYLNVKKNRKAQQIREALIARVDTDSELVSLAPDLSHVTEKDVEMFSSRSVPVATKARVNHMEQLRIMKLPWYRKLGDEYQDTMIEEEEDFRLF